MKAGWNSLEIAKLIVPIVSSLLLAAVGLMISQNLATFKSTMDRNDKMIDSVVQKRISLYDAIGTKLNAMFAYYMYVGKWKELSPEDVIKNKRQLDEIVYTYQPFFSQEFIDSYRELEQSMFRSFTGWGQDAKLRTEVQQRQTFYQPTDKTSSWNKSWDTAFTNEDNTQAIRSAYSKLVSLLPLELGIPRLASHDIRSISVEQVARPNLPPKNLREN
jgi:hypothetical protein